MQPSVARIAVREIRIFDHGELVTVIGFESSKGPVKVLSCFDVGKSDLACTDVGVKERRRVVFGTRDATGRTSGGARDRSCRGV